MFYMPNQICFCVRPFASGQLFCMSWTIVLISWPFPVACVGMVSGLLQIPDVPQSNTPYIIRSRENFALQSYEILVHLYERI